ncbi:MAG TPA: HD domain-containing phosphohydrolase [Stellaceae bacterium]|jgi:HD-GYP domain-containing protein (c-di-GMP phosphodiesterase class II)
MPRAAASPPDDSANSTAGQAAGVHGNPVLEFLDFIDEARTQPLPRLLYRVLLKARQLTDAEAGSIFLVQGTGQRRRLVPGSLQNDVVRVPASSFSLPVSRGSIAGYVAATGETLFLDDLHAIPPDRPFAHRQELDRRNRYVSKTMLAFPLTNGRGSVAAVVQLINRRPNGSAAPLPFEPRHAALIAPVNHFAGRAIERAAMSEAIVEKNRRLRAQRQRILALQAETEDAFMLSIRLLAKAAELHDEVTGNHIVRVNEYSYALARHAGQAQAWCDEIRYSAQLHDVGKMSIDAAVLKKKGGLTSEEWGEMRRHPFYGYEILRQSPRLAMAADIARCHHEKWDGSGYPARLAGEAIPLSARIVAVADIYDALRSARPYKPGFSHDETCRIMLEGDGRIDPDAHFDPDLLAVFAANHQEMDRIWLSLRDDGAPPA